MKARRGVLGLLVMLGSSWGADAGAAPPITVTNALPDRHRDCCGAGMVQDGTFGTHWEFTPNGGGSNDFVNLSTNSGSGPRTPPKLCGPGVDPNDCVNKAANIFYNVPVAWTTNLDCNFTSQGRQVKGLRCVSVDCPDAYTHPTDDKQAACPVNPTRGYAVQFCPAGSSMPTP